MEEVEIAYPQTSPVRVKINKQPMSFGDAMRLVIEGKRVTRDEWQDRRHYGLLKDNLLHIHKAGEKEGLDHPWILNDGDLKGVDWEVI